MALQKEGPLQEKQGRPLFRIPKQSDYQKKVITTRIRIMVVKGNNFGSIKH